MSNDQKNSTSAPTSSNEDVYVMPEKFHPQITKSSSNQTLLIVVIVLVLVVVASGTYFLYDMSQRNKASVLDANVNANVSNQAVVNTNVNANRNINRNTNGNLNSNINTNANANANVNNNANLNSNSNTNNNTNTNTNANLPVVVIPSGDADRDGLTDLEENLIGSSATSPDSDQDGYLDGEEVIAGYNPIVASVEGQPYTLLEADFISRLETNFTENNFTTIYIKGWSVNLIDALHEARIITGTGEMIRISVVDNIDNISATNWYLLNHSNVSLSQLDNISFGDFKGIYSPDHLTAYLVTESKDKFYILEYDLDNRSELRYPTIFDMVINNFSLVSNPKPSTSSTSTSTQP